MSEPAHRYLFIGGLHRSGTTMLARFLAEHPEISGFSDTGVPADEGQHLQTVYPPPSPGRQAGRFAFLPEAHLTEESPLVGEENRRLLLSEWNRHWDLRRPVLLEKSPPNLLSSRFLQALLPDSSFVFVLRHPIAVSCATQKWSATRPHELLAHWVHAHRIALTDVSYLRSVMLVRYEDLIADPDTVLGGVFRFAGLADHAPGRRSEEGVNADNFAGDRTPRASVNEQYFERWQRRKASPLKRGYLALLEARYERAARAFGYGLRNRAVFAPSDPLVARLLDPSAT
ncbi:MAG: sulfotransferase [Gaiellales bacterium]